jgi:hypothetical protein
VRCCTGRGLVAGLDLGCDFPMHSYQFLLEQESTRNLLQRNRFRSHYIHHQRCDRFHHRGHAHANHMEARYAESPQGWCLWHLPPWWCRCFREYNPAGVSSQPLHIRPNM